MLLYQDEGREAASVLVLALTADRRREREEGEGGEREREEGGGGGAVVSGTLGWAVEAGMTLAPCSVLPCLSPTRY
eukprot:3676123-Rhodomonas_salina.5